MLSAGVFLHFTSKWHHIQQEKEGQCASQKTSSCETLPATTDMHMHTHVRAHTRTHAHAHTNRKNNSAIARVAIYHGSLYLIFRLICQVYSLANLNTNVNANEDSLFLHRLCVEA